MPLAAFASPEPGCGEASSLGSVGMLINQVPPNAARTAGIPLTE